jgi:hypothetical protein
VTAGTPEVSEAPDPRRPARKRDVITRMPLWRRLVDSFTAPVTPRQVVLETLLGAVLPVFIVWLDRYWDPMGDGGALPLGRVYVMLLATLGGAAVVVHHAARVRAPRVAAAAGGALWATGFVACGVGLVILPLSVIGVLFMGIGLLGFTPWLVGLVHFRCARRARLVAEERAGRDGARWMVVAMTLAVLGVAAVGGKGAKTIAYRDQQVLLGERSGDRTWALRRLRVLWHYPGVPLFRLRALARDQGEWDRANLLHREITGRGAPWYDDS